MVLLTLGMVSPYPTVVMLAEEIPLLVKKSLTAWARLSDRYWL